MKDVELARSLLEKENLSLVIAREGQIIFRSGEKGMRPFLQAIRERGVSLHNAAVADRVIGSAAAMLCLYGQVAAVYALVASERALAMLEEKDVDVTAEKLTPYIFNNDRSDLCPFEKLAQGYEQPSQLFSALESLLGEAKI